VAVPIASDKFGEWYQLGQVQPIDYNVWYDLTPDHEIHSAVYRLSFISEQFDLIHSFFWVRSIFLKDGQELYSQSRKVFPHPVPLFIEMPVPINLKSVGVTSQRLQFKKLLTRWAGSDYLWTVKVEELYLVRPQSTKSTVLIPLVHIKESYALPEYPALWVTVFEENTGYDVYELGRFYTADTDEIVSDPIVETYPNRVKATFTRAKPVEPNTIKMRIVI
jgi:hypothetical protein